MEELASIADTPDKEEDHEYIELTTKHERYFRL